MAPSLLRCAQTAFDGARCWLPVDHDIDTALPDYGHDFGVRAAEHDPRVPDLAGELAQWWRDAAESEIAQTVAKATEYSGLGGGLPQDLVDFGRQIAFVQRREHDYTDAELAEVGVWAYIQGKVNRWSSALRNGQAVSDDTLLDIGVYVRIAQRIRATGQWP